MARKDYGTSLNTSLTNKTVEEVTTDGAQLRIEKTVNTASAGVFINNPALGTVLPTNTAYALRRISKETLPGGLTKIILTYESSTSTGSLPENTIVEQGTVEEIDIRLHPNFSDWQSEWDSEREAFKPSSDKYGITSYLVGAMTVTKTTYYSSQPNSLHGILGSLQSPGGGYGGNQNWIVIGGVRRKVGNYWVTEITYKFSDRPYDQDIYD